MVGSKVRDKRIAYSQNFLTNQYLVRSLVEQSSISSTDIVYEIGPGRGIITDQLARLARRVIGVEIDEDLAQALRRRFATTSNVKIISADFLSFSPAEERYKIFSNIPFSITSDIVRKIAKQSSRIDDAYLVMQFEAARKFIGLPYALETQTSILTKAEWSIGMIHEFSASDFSPRPSVRIVLVRLQPLEETLVSRRDMPLFRDLVVYVFGHSVPDISSVFRKTSLKDRWKVILQASGIDRTKKPSDMRLSDWAALYGAFSRGASESARRIVLGSERAWERNLSKLPRIHRTRVARDWRRMPPR